MMALGIEATRRDDSPLPAAGVSQRSQRWPGVWSLPDVRWALIAIVLFVLALAAQLADAPSWLWWALYLASYITGGWSPGWAGLQALWERKLDVDLLMVLAAVGAASIGQVFDGGLLIIIFASSGALEAVATRRTEDSIRGLLDLAPERATRLLSSGEEVVDTIDLQVGDLIIVRPGERIGTDGEVVDGASEVDQAGITGEPLPADKRAGDEVFAGTLNGTGVLRVRVSRPAGDTVIARIVAMVSEASATKARTQLFVEEIEQRYSIAMVTATVALFVIPLLVGAPMERTLLRAMTFMIVASPCAVVLSTMPPLLSAMANAGRHGVLVKSAVVMEQLGTVAAVAFDKTGTLTEGMPRLAAIRVVPGAHSQDELLALAAAAEYPSEHPLARAVVAAARDTGLTMADADDFSSAPGRGVRARVDAVIVEVGNPAFVLDAGDESAAITGIVAELEQAGQTAVAVCVDGRAVGVLGLSDRVRPDAAQTVAALTALTGSPPLLLTGDNAAAARQLAAEVGITDVRAGLLPEDKLIAVRELEARSAKVMLVGDGVNDAPALAAAHTGIAMARAGGDLVIDAADAVITRNELVALPALLVLARRARRLVVANLVIAASFIAVLATWDIFWTLPLPLGVAGHEGSTVIVGLNGLRLLRSAAWPQAAAWQGPDRALKLWPSWRRTRQ